MSHCSNLASPFTGGRLARFIPSWKRITSDSWVLDTVAHYHIEFDSIPFQLKAPNPINFTKKEVELIDLEIEKLLDKDRGHRSV